MSWREYRAVFWLLPLAAASAWLANLGEVEEAAPAATQAHSVDYFSTTYSKLEMDAQGKPKDYLRAAKMMHYSDNKTTELTQPWMTFYNEDEPPWEVRSATARLSADGKDLYLDGEAHIDRAAAPGVRMLKINTSNLRVKPETSYAETDDWAELISTPDITTGTGMKVTFRKPIHLQLLSNVKGRYEVD